MFGFGKKGGLFGNFTADIMNEEIEDTPVVSSNIQSIGWKNNRMFVTFNSGRVYTYYDVQRHEVEDFLNASSKGHHFWQMFRDYKSFIEGRDEI